jgi:hypothetical protein
MPREYIINAVFFNTVPLVLAAPRGYWRGLHTNTAHEYIGLSAGKNPQNANRRFDVL